VSTGPGDVDIRRFKNYVGSLGADHPLRPALAGEPDFLSRSALVEKVPIWLALLSSGPRRGPAPDPVSFPRGRPVATRTLPPASAPRGGPR
jgi:hypothetical protein